ncbi:MAG TPA: glycosyltransferase family 2 protein [Gemmatimonadales bacterium]|nr:glycosyltransferase family 2 protein [Gemmatimonadales bacterium]
MSVPPYSDKTARAVREDVAVVLVNYRGAGDTIEALESLLAADPAPGLLVVVDNASGDDSVARLEEWALGSGVAAARLSEAGGGRSAGGARLLIIEATANHGFGGGVNVGVRALGRSASYVVLINNDATVDPGFLGPVLAVLDADKTVGLAGGTIRYAPPREGVWFAGGELVWLQSRGRHLHLPPDRVRDITFCTGCYMVVRRDSYDVAGGMPECYFLYQEDVEFSARLRAAGYRLVHVPDSVVYHKVSATAGSRRVSPGTAYLASRNRLWFARRNLAWPRRLAATAWVLLDETNRALGALLRGSADVSRAVLRGLVHGLLRRWPRHGPARYE